MVCSYITRGITVIRFALWCNSFIPGMYWIFHFVYLNDT